MTELSALGLVLAGLTTFGEPFTHLRRWSSAVNSAVSFKNALRFFFKDNNTGHHKPLFYFHDREQEAARFQTEETSRVEDHTTKEFYKNIILFKNGSKAMEIYKALHPEGKFRD